MFVINVAVAGPRYFVLNCDILYEGEVLVHSVDNTSLLSLLGTFFCFVGPVPVLFVYSGDFFIFMVFVSFMYMYILCFVL